MFRFSRAISICFDIPGRHTMGCCLLVLVLVLMLVPFGTIHREYAQGLSHLYRSKANSWRVIHGLEHVIDKLAQLVVDTRNRSGFLPQYRVGNMNDGQE